jgi:hypothetical protein
MIDSVLAFFSSRKQQDNAPFWLLIYFHFSATILPLHHVELSGPDIHDFTKAISNLHSYDYRITAM